ncbi:hypothetical protein X777_11546 [Ooceraea biroi]|nr:hypothetical protein X777_11546 [Ooceraea biroi]
MLRERRKRPGRTRRSRSRRARGRRRSRARRGRRRGRRQVRRRSRRRRRRGRRSEERTRARSRADSGEMEMEAVAAGSKGNATSKDGDLRESETSMAERSNERDMQGSSQNSQRSNTPDDV